MSTTLRRDQVGHHGTQFDLSCSGDGATGQGQPLKLIIRPQRADLPIYLGAIGPRNVELATEAADGWLPGFGSPERIPAIWGDSLRQRRPEFDIAATVPVVVGPDLDECARRSSRVPRSTAWDRPEGTSITTLARRYGYEEAAVAIQDLFMAGQYAERPPPFPTRSSTRCRSAGQEHGFACCSPDGAPAW